jgi:hypothetical protein
MQPGVGIDVVYARRWPLLVYRAHLGIMTSMGVRIVNEHSTACMLSGCDHGDRRMKKIWEEPKYLKILNHPRHPSVYIAHAEQVTTLPQ